MTDFQTPRRGSIALLLAGAIALGACSNPNATRDPFGLSEAGATAETSAVLGSSITNAREGGYWLMARPTHVDGIQVEVPAPDGQVLIPPGPHQVITLNHVQFGKSYEIMQTVEDDRLMAYTAEETGAMVGDCLMRYMIFYSFCMYGKMNEYSAERSRTSRLSKTLLEFSAVNGERYRPVGAMTGGTARIWIEDSRGRRVSDIAESDLVPAGPTPYGEPPEVTR